MEVLNDLMGDESESRGRRTAIDAEGIPSHLKKLGDWMCEQGGGWRCCFIRRWIVGCLCGGIRGCKSLGMMGN